MSKKLIYRNALGAELVISNSAPFLLEKIEQNNNIDIYNSKGVQQDGATYLGNSLDVRDISVKISIIAANTEELINFKSKINKIFNPRLGEGYLIYSDEINERKVKCIVNKLPYFSTVNSRTNKCLISITANNPFWLDTQENKQVIATWIGGMTFPLALGTSFATKGSPEIVIKNEGDVGTPITVGFSGPATNPVIENKITGEFIKVNRTLLNTDKLHVSTEFGNKYVEIEDTITGKRTNAFNWISLDSTFFNLQIGTNVIRCDSDEGTSKSKISIEWVNRYISV